MFLLENLPDSSNTMLATSEDLVAVKHRRYRLVPGPILPNEVRTELGNPRALGAVNAPEDKDTCREEET